MKSFNSQFLRDIFKELLANKVNVFFMILALVISLTALNTIYSLGISAKKEILESLASVQFGKDAMLIIAGGGRIIGLTTTRRDTLTLEDIKEIERLDFVKLASPISGGILDVSYKDVAEKIRVQGVLPNYAIAGNWYPEIGRFINDKDIKTLAKVCVVGYEIPKKFGIPYSDVLGKEIKIAGIYFKIVGVLKPKAFLGPHKANERILIPLTTAQRRVFNRDYIEVAKLLFREGTDMKLAEEKIRKILRKRHHLSPLEPDDFRIITPELAISIFTRTLRTINAYLIAISLISLIISGIIIMNLMYASIEEKAPFIALRIALGATSGQIIKHYLAMVLIIAIVSGFLGLILGLMVAQIVFSFTSLKFYFSWTIFLYSFGFAISTCLIFSLIPAIKATRIEPSILLRNL